MLTIHEFEGFSDLPIANISCDTHDKRILIFSKRNSYLSICINDMNVSWQMVSGVNDNSKPIFSKNSWHSQVLT